MITKPSLVYLTMSILYRILYYIHSYECYVIVKGPIPNPVIELLKDGVDILPW